MKTKFIYIAALALLVSFTACEKQAPFDTQSPNDQPLILKPYNESGTGSFTYSLANPDTPLFDSVTVTPSNYTTVNWYLDGDLVYTGNKIEMCFPAGKYELVIEAVTQAGKRTERKGSVTVNPYSSDPYSAAPSAGRHFVPGSVSALDGAHLSQVEALDFTSDVFGQMVLKSVIPSSTTDSRIEFMMPEMEDGIYFVRLKDASGKLYGADKVQVHNSAIVLDGFNTFAPNAEWTITGLKLQNVKSVKLDDQTITELTVTGESITFTAPDVEYGEHTLAILDKEGVAVPFLTANGLVTEVKTLATQETTLWTGPVALDWNADLVNITAAQMADVPVGSTILVYYDVPDAEYHNMRITTPWWGDDLVAQFDVKDDTPRPFTFTYDDRCKGIVDMVGSWSIVGFGETITKVTYK